MKIKLLSNIELLGHFGQLVQTERKITHLVLECIAEIDSRRLYLDKAYPSLYEFLVQEFGYSSSAALRRIESARILKEIPDVAAKIESGALNLSQLSKVQQAVRTVQKLENRKLDISEKKDLLGRIEFATQRQTENILSQALSLPIFVEDKELTHRDHSVTLTITFNKEQMAFLNEVRDLIAHAVPEKKWSEVLAYLAKKEIQRRTKILEKKIFQEAAGPSKMTDTALKPLTASTKKVVLQKEGRCQFKDPDTGKVCGSTRFLQVDHRQPIWAAGGNESSNLQILCAEHNRHKYRKESGVLLKSNP